MDYANCYRDYEREVSFLNSIFINIYFEELIDKTIKKGEFR